MKKKKCSNRCCKNIPKKGYKSCERCLEGATKWYRANKHEALLYHKIRAEKLHQQSKCDRCKGPLTEGRLTCRTCRNKRKTKWSHLKIVGICVRCKKNKVDKFVECDPCRARLSAYRTARQRMIRKTVLDRYGKVCACCGEANSVFLTLDHINEDGHKDRMPGNRTYPGTYYSSLFKAETIRKDLQVLCYNCNNAKHRNGGTCPHPKLKLGYYSQAVGCM